MLNLQVSSLLKVLTIIDNGVCEDGRSWVRCSALSFFDEEEQIMTLTAFGHYADMIMDNHSGENMRRAIVTGKLIATKQKEPKTKHGFTTMVWEWYFQIVADTVHFIDKSNIEKEVDEEEISTNALPPKGTIIDFTEDDDDELIDLTSAKDKGAVATSDDDIDEIVYNTTNSYIKNKKNKKDEKNKKNPLAYRQRAKSRTANVVTE